MRFISLIYFLVKPTASPDEACGKESGISPMMKLADRDGEQPVVLSSLI